ncbi:wall-associated receptor kinase 17 isoform X2 [Oryza sativa Japonica Group]|uniref:wall-associated receptor kinase 17 isoform X2 n=1 Tax=Oryza sativa subsp. japonica TaxID=39947 RepID=UPI000E1B90DB|nr:wall-associated receptor kinase 3 isoform X2 [Oryza sativa Japonica Group]
MHHREVQLSIGDMVCRRASIPAATEAAAVASWPLGPLALALALAILSAMPHVALSQNLTCKDVPFPFREERSGATSVPGFMVTCGRNNEAMLRIGEHIYKIDKVSVPEHFITIRAGPIQQVCYDRSRRPKQIKPITRVDPAPAPTSLQATPFTFSRRNKLVATGCNYRFFANFTSSSGGGDGTPTSCDTWCNDGSSDTIFNGSCADKACCTTEMQMDGAQEFNLTLKPSGNVEASTCSAVFFLDKDEQVFTSAGDGRNMALKEALVPLGYRKMFLDWAIPGNCEQNSASQYPCGSMSTCNDVYNGTSYICRCNEGYEGNPYEQNGCSDINECRDMNNNNCSRDATCTNTDGGFTCSCPKNTVGDGYRAGTGCSIDSLPPSEYCKDEQGVTSCACPEGRNGDGRKKGSGCKRHFPLDTALGVGLALTVTLATTLLCYYWTMKKRKVARKRAELFRKNGGLLLQQRFLMITSQGEESSAKIFSAEELKNATDNYSDGRILGRGANGTVYKGILPNRTTIAIKKSILFDESHVEQFVNEITILSQIDHPNVVKLLGCCLETKVPLLVYEFIPNGTLFQHIHNKRTLTWEDCLRIAEETAGALAYLHSTSSTPIIHRDIKSSNILLDENFVAKIADFGASRSVPSDHTHVTTLIQGTIGYLDPEYFQTSQLTEKSDVYSFGVVLAELLTRQKPISVGRPEESCNLAMYIVILLNERRLLQEIEPQILVEAGEEQIYAVAQLSARCLNVKGEERPVMREVASVLHGLRESFDEEQIIRSDESIQIINEQESVHSEARPISSLQSSDETSTTQYSLPSEILSASHLER